MCVDLATTRVDVAGDGHTIHMKPDVETDLRKLPFPDDYADEARAIHVIEHFWVWEALPLLQEWVRVLKPGAKLAIECPCLEKVLALAQVPECPPAMTYWALYGDPRYQEPAMMHRWCYGKMQLGKLMSQAGLVNVHAEPVQFHQPIRDMRLVGYKPDESRILVEGRTGV
ncbi:MAG TPA: methyltransferase domain-containing protein [Casimicrobiaceae bacterium]|jgi:SAM-dependent methyltransferase